MFLSRLKMSLADPGAQHLLANPYVLHQALMRAFPSPAGRVLLRVEKQREDTEAATALAYDDYDPTDTSRLRSFGGLPEGLPPVWTPVGGDNELRDRLLERIAQKLKVRG